jgi:hypothetical protein
MFRSILCLLKYGERTFDEIIAGISLYLASVRFKFNYMGLYDAVEWGRKNVIRYFKEAVNWKEEAATRRFEFVSMGKYN